MFALQVALVAPRGIPTPLPQRVPKRTFSDAKPFSRKRSSTGVDSGTGRGNFNTHAAAAMVQIYRAVSPLLAMNDGFKWSSPHPTQLDVLQRVADAYSTPGGVSVAGGSADAANALLAPIAQSDTAFAMSLDCGPARGSYMFTVDREQERLNVQSPVSGTFSYVYVTESCFDECPSLLPFHTRHPAPFVDVVSNIVCLSFIDMNILPRPPFLSHLFPLLRYVEEQGLWLSVQDGHDMRGLVTRDLLRHCRGCPNF